MEKGTTIFHAVTCQSISLDAERAAAQKKRIGSTLNSKTKKGLNIRIWSADQHFETNSCNWLSTKLPQMLRIAGLYTWRTNTWPGEGKFFVIVSILQSRKWAAEPHPGHEIIPSHPCASVTVCQASETIADRPGIGKCQAWARPGPGLWGLPNTLPNWQGLAGSLSAPARVSWQWQLLLLVCSFTLSFHSLGFVWFTKVLDLFDLLWPLPDTVCFLLYAGDIWSQSTIASNRYYRAQNLYNINRQ